MGAYQGILSICVPLLNKQGIFVLANDLVFVILHFETSTNTAEGKEGCRKRADNYSQTEYA